MLSRPPTYARGGMIVTAHPSASAAGLAALQAGGSAVDALVAAGTVLSVVEPGASGLGGDAFLLVAPPGEDVTAVNASGAAPARLTRDVFAGLASVPVRGARSLTTPGCVAGWHSAWQRWGKLPWRDLFAHAERHASGFAVSGRLARTLRIERATILADPGLSSVFAPRGELLDAGEICRSPALVDSLRAIAVEGPATFYGGALGTRLVSGLERLGGLLSLEDLRAHRTEVTSAVPFTRADGTTLYEQPLPSQGVVLSIEVGIVEAHAALHPPRGGRLFPWEELHRQVEAKRLAFALRDALLTDPRHLPVPAEELYAALLSPSLHYALAASIGDSAIGVEALDSTSKLAARGAALRAFALAGGADILARYRAAGWTSAQGGGEGTDTTYLCAVDASGLAVGLIQSVFQVFGSGVLEPSTGILLNDRAVGFSLDPGHVNRLEPGKRTLHTLNSLIVRAGDRCSLVLGTPGGDNQVQTTLQVLRHLDHGGSAWPGPPAMLPQKWTQAREPLAPLELEPGRVLARALEAPRWRHDDDGRVRFESRLAADTRRRFESRGHLCTRIGPWDGSGLVQAIRVLRDQSDARVLIGATDPRGEGAAIGS